MAFLKVNACVTIMIVTCMEHFVESKELLKQGTSSNEPNTSCSIIVHNIRKLEEQSMMLTQGFTSEKAKIRGEVAELENKIMDLRYQHNESFSDLEIMGNEIHTIRKLEEQSMMLTKGFTGEKAKIRAQIAELENKIMDLRYQHNESISDLEMIKNETLTIGMLEEQSMMQLREQVAELENKIMDLRYQHNESISDLKMTKNEIIVELNRTVYDTLSQKRTELEENVSINMKRYADSFETLRLSLEDDVSSSLKKTLDEMKETLSVNQNEEAFNDFRDKIDNKLKQIKEKQEETDKKTQQLLEAMDKKFTSYCLSKGGATFENSCYLLFESKKTWNEAVDKCLELGSHLVEPNSRSKSQFLADTYKGVGGIWLGGSDRSNEGMWEWQSNNQAFGYQNWAPNEPNNTEGNENCLVRHSNGDKWNDIPCHKTLKYVCEFSIQM